MASRWRDDDSECSDTSLASTQESEPADDYTVECVVARRPDGDGDYEYLVRWEGYPEHRNTWEPVSSFASEQAVKELWRERLQVERRGKTRPFELDGWERDQYDREAAAERRRAKRRKERARREAAKSKRARLTPKKKRKLDTSSETHRSTEKLSSKRRHVLLDDSSDDDIPLVKSTFRQRSQDTRTDSPVSDLIDSRLSTPSLSLFVHSSDLPLNPPPPTKPRPIANMKPLSQSTSANQNQSGSSEVLTGERPGPPPTPANQNQSGSSNAPAVQQPQPTNAPTVQRSQPPPIFQRSKPIQRERNNDPGRPRGPRMHSSVPIQTNAELFRILNGQRNLNERPDLEALTFIDLKTGQDDTATHDALVRQKNLQQQ